MTDLESRQPAPAVSTLRSALGWFAGATALYGLSAARGPVWADSSKLTLYALSGYLPSLNPGDHPGWTLLARAWLTATGGLSPVRALHLLSALTGASAIALVFVLVSRWTGERARGHTAAALLMVAHSLWWPAAVTESYAPALALAVMALLLAASPGAGRAAGAGLVAGLAASTHPFTLVLTAPIFAARWKRFALWAGAAVGSAPLWLGVFGTPLDPLTGHASGGGAAWSWHLHQFLSPRRFAVGAVLLLGVLVLNLGPVGCLSLVRRPRGSAPHPFRRTAWAALAVYLLLLCVYSPFRIHVMALFAVAAAVLLAAPQLRLIARCGHVVVQAAIYLCLPLVVAFAGHADLGVRRLPERDNARYFLCPVKTFDGGAGRYARELLGAAPRGAVILADFNPGAVIALVQRSEALRPDVEVRPTAIDEILDLANPAATLETAIEDILASGKPVILADRWEPYYHASELESSNLFELLPSGPGWRVVPAASPVQTRPSQ